MGLVSRSESCCCFFGVKKGTLILLSFDLFCSLIKLILSITVSHYSPSISEIEELDDFADEHGNKPVFLIAYKILKNTVLPCIVIGSATFLVVTLVGLFGIMIRKSFLLIPYFITRILFVVAVILLLVFALFVQKEVVAFIDGHKQEINVSMATILSTTGNKHLYKYLKFGINIAVKSLYFFMSLEVLMIPLYIHYAKVVYACYKQIQEDAKAKNQNHIELSSNYAVKYSRNTPAKLKFTKSIPSLGYFRVKKEILFLLLNFDLLCQIHWIIRNAFPMSDPTYEPEYWQICELMWYFITVAFIILAIVGIENHRPSFIPPYICTWLVTLVLLVQCMVVEAAQSTDRRNRIMHISSSAMNLIAACNKFVSNLQGEKSSWGHEYIQNEDAMKLNWLRDPINTIFAELIFIWVLRFAIACYFVAVLVCYYLKMREQDRELQPIKRPAATHHRSQQNIEDYPQKKGSSLQLKTCP